MLYLYCQINNGGIKMTNPIKKNADKISKLVAIAVVALFVFSACSDDNNTLNNTLNFSGKLVEHSECKYEKSDEVPENTQVDFTFDNATNKLTLKHFNVEFNCCPDYLYTDVSLVNDTILIQEFEAASLCNCTCLYDLDILVTGVEAKKYTIKIVEPYYSGEQKIIFDVDLNEIKNGSFSVVRE